MQSIKLTWLIIDDTPIGTDVQICDFLCVQVLQPLFVLLEHSSIKVGMAISLPLLQFLIEEEDELWRQLRAFVDNGTIELVLPLSFPSQTLSQEHIHAHIEHKNRIYRRFFGVGSHVLLPFGFAYDHRLLAPAQSLGFKHLIVHRKSMDASAGVVQHRFLQMNVLGVDAKLSAYSEQGTAKEFFIRLRDVAKKNHGSAILCSYVHNIGLKHGSFDRCWNKGLMKTIMQGIQQSQKWLKLIVPSAHRMQRSVFPLVGYFPLHATSVLSWKRVFYENPELVYLWVQLQYIETQCSEASQHQSLIELQEGSVFVAYPNGRLENMQLRYLIWYGITEQRESYIVSAAEHIDRDGDGIQELYFRSSIGDGACVLALGGMITFLLIPGVGNIGNVLTRRDRDWHRELAYDPRMPLLIGDVYKPGLTPQNTYFYNKIGYDNHHRGIFSDVLYALDVQLTQLRKGQARVYADLTKVEYRLLAMEEDEDGIYYDIEAQILLKTVNGEHSLTIQKYYYFSFQEKLISVEYTVENNSLEPVSFLWGTELNIGLHGKLRPEMLFRMFPNPFSCSMVQAGHRKICTAVEWIFTEGRVRADISEPSSVFFYPVEVPRTEPSYIDMSFQGHCAMFGVPVEMWAGEKKVWRISCSWER